MDLWHTLFVIWYIENGISYKTSLDIWRIEIIGSGEVVIGCKDSTFISIIIK